MRRLPEEVQTCVTRRDPGAVRPGRAKFQLLSEGCRLPSDPRRAGQAKEQGHRFREQHKFPIIVDWSCLFENFERPLSRPAEAVKRD